MDPTAPIPLPVAPDSARNELLLFEGAEATGDVSKGPVRIWVDLDGEVRIRWEMSEFSTSDTIPLTLDHPTLGRLTVDASVTWSDLGGCRGVIDHFDSDPTASTIRRINVAWVNLGDVTGPGVLAGPDGSRWSGHLELRAGDWLVTLDPMRELRTIIDGMAQRRRFGVTHSGSVERLDGRLISANEAARITYGVQVMLSFALGRFIAPAVPTGLDDDDRVVWQQWAPWMCDPIRGQQGWWSRRDIEGLTVFADRFLRAWDDPAEHDIVRYLSRHVLAANHGPTTTEARVAMAVAGLEYLSWVDAVLTRGRDPKEHKNLPAYVRIRELLVQARIDVSTPSELTALGRFCDDRSFDGPEAVTWMRNRLIHPKDPAEPYKLEGLLAEVWLLALSYLELCLLHRIGFEGHYMPRWPPGRWEGTTEQVPWTSSAQLNP